LSSNLFSFNSQGFLFFRPFLENKLILEVLTLDLETEECLIEINDASNNCQFDDYEENSKEWSIYMNKGGKRKMEDRVFFKFFTALK